MTDAAFWDRIAPKYAKSKISNPDAYQQSLARVRTYLNPDHSVLELGCGTGSTALLLVEDTGPYVATDISSGMIEIAKGKLTNHPGAAVEFRVAGVNPGDYAGETFDTVLAFNLLHLVPDLEGAFGMIRDALPTGGLFISKTPALAGKWYFKPLIKAMQLFGRAPFVRMLGVEELDQMIEAAGFEIVETGLYPPSTPSRFVVARKR
jgi:ubiquinone/menaquinone biosynthesis C-methylase UbiE